MAQTSRREVDFEAHRTRDHERIRRWVEERGGRPAVVRGTQILRIDFEDPNGSIDENLQPVPWEEFFRLFDERSLDFVYQEKTQDGKVSRFNKFVAGPDAPK